MPHQEVEIALLEQKVQALEDKVDTMSRDVRDLADAWKAAGTLVAFVKTVAAVVVAITVIIGSIKFGITGDGK
jgi:diacylglycerol kinase